MNAVVTETHGQAFVIRLNRPERLNALGEAIREGLNEAWNEFEQSKALEVAILTGTGRGFCAGEDMKETLERGKPGSPINDLYWTRRLTKPVISAINGFAMGGGFMMVERSDLRVAVKSAVFEISEAKRWLLGGYNHGHFAGLPHPIATEMALGFRFTAERLYQVGFLNRIVDEEAQLLPCAMEMAEHMLSLIPASRVNTTYMMRQMQPAVAPELQQLAAALHEHGWKEDRMESRKAFAEKRKPDYRGWEKPEDRYNPPTLESIKAKQ